MDQETTTKSPLLNRLGQALLTALLTVLYFIIVLPYKLWEFAVDSIGSQSAGDTFRDAFKTDVPLMTSYVTYLNAVIVVLPFVLFIVGIFIAANSYYSGFTTFLFWTIIAYLSPLMMAFFKEIITLPISIANNIKKIADK